MADDLFKSTLEYSGVGDGSGEARDHAGAVIHQRSTSNDSGEENIRTAVLLQEHHRAVGVLDRLFDYILRVAAIGFSAAGALLILVASNKDMRFGEWVFWAAPVSLALLYALIIYLVYQITFLTYYVRDVENDIAENISVSYFHFQTASARGLSNFRTGLPQMQGLLALFVVFAVGLYITLAGTCLYQIYVRSVPLWRETVFVSVQLAFVFTLLWSAIGATSSLQQRYDLWKGLSRKEYEKGIVLSRNLVPTPAFWSYISYAVLPRKLDFVIKPLITIGSGIAVVLLMPSVLNQEAVTTLLLATVCLEFFAKQATYIWNDLLDMPSDQNHFRKKEIRFLLRANARTFGKTLFLVRTTLALAMAIVLWVSWQLWWMPLVIVVVYFWQLIYERWGKRSPVPRLTMVSLGYGTRTVTGSLAVMSVVDHYDVILIVVITAWFAVLQGMIIANIWASEYWHRLGRGESFREEPSRGVYGGNRTLKWFGCNNDGIQVWGAINLALVGIFIASRYGKGYHGSRSLIPWPGGIEEATHLGAFEHVAGFVSLMLFCVVFGCGVIFMIRSQLRRRMNEKYEVDSSFRRRKVIILVFFSVMFLLLLSGEPRVWALFVAIPLVLTAGSAFLTYEEQCKLEDRIMKIDQLIPWLNWKLFEPDQDRPGKLASTQRKQAGNRDAIEV